MNNQFKPVISQRLRPLLIIVFILFLLLATNSVYLSSVTWLQWYSGEIQQNYLYQVNFLLHLLLGLLILLPFLLFASVHLHSAWRRENKTAIKAGLALFAIALILLFSGIVLVRLDPLVLIDPLQRQWVYWVHALAGPIVIVLFVLHRLANKRKSIRWRFGLAGLALSAGGYGLLVILHAQERVPNNYLAEPLLPALSRVAGSDDNRIPAQMLMRDDYCQQCHEDVHQRWTHSVHRFSSFNNPAYLASIRETREVVLERDGNVIAARFCAGCHDPVPLFSGAFDQADFDDVNDPSADAGITCSVCHSIVAINSARGNAAYTIAEPVHYPFAFDESPSLQWLSRQLIKAKPEFHKKTFLKPLHRSAEFCSTCHKVHLPAALNHYRWLRGQNHYDSFLLSGVSGHSVTSFYYPPQATANCNTCHMPLKASQDFGANFFDDSGQLTVHDHLFPAANTAIAQLQAMPDWVKQTHQEFLSETLRLDIFALREGESIAAPMIAPLRPQIPTLEPGRTYLLDVVIRNLKVGHLFTQGTSDSNEIWLELVVRCGDRVIGHSGAIKPDSGSVDPWAYFVNAYLLDRNGQRIDRRNVQDIFVKLYDHQIPPGSADVVHYRVTLPDDVDEPVDITVKLNYRKFDTAFMRFFQGDQFASNDLPVTVIAQDQIRFELHDSESVSLNESSEIPVWQRWNDYGIGLLRKGELGELRQAEQAFHEVSALGRSEGLLNLARVYLKEGRLREAAQVLTEASQHESLTMPWSLTWLSGLVNQQNGFFTEAIADFESLVETRFADARRRGFDFSFDYRLLNELGKTYFEQAKRQRGDTRREQREDLLRQAEPWFQRTLSIDPENAPAHYNLSLLYQQLGQSTEAEQHRLLHSRYKSDDNAREFAVAQHRRQNPAADHAAEASAIYPVPVPGAGDHR